MEEKINPAEKLSLSRREFIFKSILTLPFLSIAYRLWDLQIINGGKFADLAAGNRIRLKLIPAPRGDIFDRNREILATNVPSYNLQLTKEDTPSPKESLQKLSHKIGIDLGQMFQIYEKRKNTAKFIPFNIVEDIAWEQMAYFLTFQNEFPGISVDYISKRFYPKGNSFSHVLGYMGGISEKELENVPEEKRQSSQILGKNGIELIYNDRLIGEDGGIQIEVNNQGRVIRELNYIEPKPGKKLVLTVDKRLQEEIERLFDGHTGSVVVTEVKTNEVLAMVSSPSFDANLFSLGISNAEWKRLTGDKSKPLINKSIQGIYSPGSTFKMLIAYAGLDLGIISKDSLYHCPGYYRNYGQTFHCWKGGGHGSVEVVSALEQSCNVFFYNLGNEIGIDRIYEYAVKFGLGEKTGISLLNESLGVIPSKEWKKEIYDRPWFPGETISVSIGQGYVTVTPLQLLNYVNHFVNGGTQKVPLLVKEIIGNDGSADQSEPPDDTLPAENLNEEYLAIIRQGMYQVLNGSRGTARSAASRIVDIAGKTGTTQVIGNKTREKLLASKKELGSEFDDHAWFVGYAPAEAPAISVVVMIENGKSGSNAARMAKKIIEYYFTAIAPPGSV